MSHGTEVDLSQGDILLVGTQLSHGKWHNSPATFWLMSIVAKRSFISATAELYYCTAHRRVSLYFTMGRPFPLKIAFSNGDLDSYLIRSSLGPPKSSTQIAS